MNLLFAPFRSRLARGGAVAVLCGLGAIACTSNDPGARVDPMPPADATVSLTEVPSPEGGTVQQLTLPGPEAGVMVVCDQEGFVPFAYADSGIDWVGCQVPNPGDAVGAESSLTAAVLNDMPSPMGGMVPQVTLPGSQTAIAVVCEGDFMPFVYQDQGDWIGCQAR